MSTLTDLDATESRALLATGTVGRVGFSVTDERGVSGPRIVPVSYTVVDEALIFRTAAYSELGRHAPDTDVAFEVDHLDHATRAGWSVVIVGRAERIEDVQRIRAIRSSGSDPEPWAEGSRQLYFRLPLDRLTGRRLRPATAC